VEPVTLRYLTLFKLCISFIPVFAGYTVCWEIAEIGVVRGAGKKFSAASQLKTNTLRRHKCMSELYIVHGDENTSSTKNMPLLSTRESATTESGLLPPPHRFRRKSSDTIDFNLFVEIPDQDPAVLKYKMAYRREAAESERQCGRVISPSLLDSDAFKIFFA
jgi:hypothetical protein